MDKDLQIKILQQTYAAVLAQQTRELHDAGILTTIQERRRSERMATGKSQAAQLGFSAPQEVFMKLGEIFGCAGWTIAGEAHAFTATASNCRLCGFAKKLGAPSPCRLNCLDPMEAMVKGLRPGAAYEVRQTLWDGAQCRVDVRVSQ